MRTFTISQGPDHVVPDGPSSLSGFYQVEFVNDLGEPLLRYLTDRGRAELLRLVDDGHREFSDPEIEELSVAPDLAALEARMDREAGEGG